RFCCGMKFAPGWRTDSERRARLLEESRFLFRRFASQNAIAMRETTEPLDHVTMAYRVIDKAGKDLALLFRHILQQLLEQEDRALLVGQRFGMFERQIEKHALDRSQTAVHAALERMHAPA